MNKLENLEIGFNLISENGHVKQFAYCEDDSVFRSILQGYNILLQTCFSELLEAKLQPHKYRKVDMLNSFMCDLSEMLLKGGDDDE